MCSFNAREKKTVKCSVLNSHLNALSRHSYCNCTHAIHLLRESFAVLLNQQLGLDFAAKTTGFAIYKYHHHHVHHSHCQSATCYYQLSRSRKHAFIDVDVMELLAKYWLKESVRRLFDVWIFAKFWWIYKINFLSELLQAENDIKFAHPQFLSIAFSLFVPHKNL